MRFWLGTHMAQWLGHAGVPLFVARPRLVRCGGSLPRAIESWALDSGGFSELRLHGGWTIDAPEYIAQAERFASEVGLLEWAAPQDWMVEPSMLARTGRTVAHHQWLTVVNFLQLRSAGSSVHFVPVLQGWTLDDYLRHVEMYERNGVQLADEWLVGVGSVCRRQNTTEAGRIIRRLASEGLALHGFGIKATGLASFADCLASADSMAWSYRARRDHQDYPDKRRVCGCKGSCANCLHFALRWREQVVYGRLNQLRMGVAV